MGSYPYAWGSHIQPSTGSTYTVEYERVVQQNQINPRFIFQSGHQTSFKNDIHHFLAVLVDTLTNATYPIAPQHVTDAGIQWAAAWV
jgi:hypothetical protein